MTRFAGKLPKGDANGLGPIHEALLDVPHKVHVVLALIDCSSTKVDHDSGDLIPTARIQRIEVVTSDDLERAHRMIDRSWQKRRGAALLPMEVDVATRSAFGESGDHK